MGTFQGWQPVQHSQQFGLTIHYYPATVHCTVQYSTQYSQQFETTQPQYTAQGEIKGALFKILISMNLIGTLAYQWVLRLIKKF